MVIPMNSVLRILAGPAVALCLVLSCGAGEAETNKPAAKPAGASPQKSELKGSRPMPFRGTVKSVDAAAQTFKIGQRTFHLAPTAKILMQDKTVAFGPALEGKWVTGSSRKTEDGKLVATSVYVGGKTASGTAAKEKSGRGAQTPSR